MNENKFSIKLSFCKVCGHEARIVNYGALSCSSCKTFFRRNALHPEIVRSCRYDKKCEVNVLTRRTCPSCRLEKCFSVGMSPDLIRKEYWHIKKNSPSTKSNMAQALKCKTILPASQLSTLDLLHNDRYSLTSSEWTLFWNVLHAYDQFSLIPTFNRIHTNLSSSCGEIHFDVTDALKLVGSVYTSMQLFISSTPDFQVLSINEQRSLFERNLRGISTCCLNILFRDTDFLDNSECCASYITLYGLEIINQFKHLISQLDPDSTLLKLMLLVIAFSSNSYIVDIDENMQNDSLRFGTFRLYGSQNVYVELLWKYMIYRYGYYQTVLRFARIVKYILDKIRQSTSIYMTNKIIRDFMDDIIKKIKEKLTTSQNDMVPLWGKTLIFS